MSETAVVIASCDGYEDAWAPFFTLFFRYWPDCPYPIYLLGETKSFDDARVKTVHVPGRKTWSRMMRECLQVLDVDYALIMLEDYLLTTPAETGRLLGLEAFARHHRATCLRLVAIPGADRDFKNHSEVGEIAKGAPYRASLMASFWNTADLQQLLRDEESAWEFETIGSHRADEMPHRFLALKPGVPSPIPYFTTGIVKGRWVKEAVELLQREGVPVDLSKRRAETFIERLYRRSRIRVLDWAAASLGRARKAE